MYTTLNPKPKRDIACLVNILVLRFITCVALCHQVVLNAEFALDGFCKVQLTDPDVDDGEVLLTPLLRIDAGSSASFVDATTGALWVTDAGYTVGSSRTVSHEDLPRDTVKVPAPHSAVPNDMCAPSPFFLTLGARTGVATCEWC